jgi:serine/threonine-protein kinase RsbW
MMSTQQPPDSTRLTIRSDLSAIPATVHQIIEEIRAHGYSDDALFAVRLALDEGISNAVRHGNKNVLDRLVHIDYHVDECAAVISIEDQGEGFHPDHLPDPTADENLEKPCGRGVMLIQAYMTEVSYNARGNRVTMVKRRDCTLPRR